MIITGDLETNLEHASVNVIKEKRLMSNEITPMTLLLDITGSTPDNRFIVGLMNYVDDTLGLDYESMQRQLEFVTYHLINKRFSSDGGLAVQELEQN